MQSRRQQLSPSGGVEGIDQSLDMLKSLQAKLKNNKHNYAIFTKKIPQSHPYTHTRIRTEPYSFSQRNPHNYETTQFTIAQKSQQEEQHRSTSPLPNTYSHSQPTMIEHNQNNAKCVKEIIKQNRKLKKYVNCLLQMNDYLKNQLVKKDQRMGVGKMGHSFQLEIMKMEIEYLKELNRDKELELKKSMCMGEAIPIPHKSHIKSKTKGHKKTPSFQSGVPTYSHARSVSAYEISRKNKNQPNYEQDHLQPMDIDYKGVMKSMRVKKAEQKTPSSNKKSINLSQKNSNSKPSTSNKNYFKKKPSTKVPNSCKKCRLCYF